MSKLQTLAELIDIKQVLIFPCQCVQFIKYISWKIIYTLKKTHLFYAPTLNLTACPNESKLSVQLWG